jgi:LacI family transcriptional regulator
MGCRRIMVVGGPGRLPQAAQRVAGARAAAQREGVGAIEVIATTDHTLESGRIIGRHIADRATTDRPDGVFATNDLLALGLLQAITSAGISVPQDIAVAGYDDIAFASMSLIPLTSVRTSGRGFGATAMDLLMEAVGPGLVAAPHRTFGVELVPRASTARRPAG